MVEENEGGEAKLCVLPLTHLTVSHPTCALRHAAHSCCNEHGKSILRRAVFQGRRNVSNIRGAESREAPPWLAPSEKNF